MDNETPVAEKYEEGGGARWGPRWGYGLLFFNATIPFAGIVVSQAAITVWILWKRYRMPREAITRIRKYRGLFSTGIAFDHTAKDVPNLVFWTLNYEGLKAKLEQFGYVVDEETY